MFTGRVRSELPSSLGVLMDGLMDKEYIAHLSLAHNAFGPDGILACSSFLEECATLKVLDVANCGLGPIGGRILAQALDNNKSAQIEEFYANRNRLE